MLLIALVFCGSIFAQQDSDIYDTHWPDFNDAMFDDMSACVAFIQLDGNFIEATGNWEDLEIAPYVGDECRGHTFMFDGTEVYGDPHPIIELSIFFNGDTPNEVVTFKMWDHAQGIMYEDCVSNVLGEPVEILTGTDHVEEYFDFDEAIILSFTSGDTPPITTVTLDKTIEPYGEEEGHYYFIASPFDGMATADVEGLITDTDYDLYFFDQNEADEWQWNGDANLVRGKGYIYASKEGTTLSFTGEPTTEEAMEVLLTKTEGSDWEGWNVVGNPFTQPAYIDRAYYTLDNSSNYIECGSESPIAPLQGILVKAENNEEPLIFNVGEYTKSANLNLNLTQNGNLIDRASVNFSNGNQLPKIQLFANSTKVYIPQDNKDYAVVRAEEMGEMPVNFKAQENGTYTLSFSNQNVEFGYLHLIDNRTGNDVDLIANPTYTFDANTTDYASRFKLVFATGNNLGDDFAFISDGNLIVNGNGTLQVFDVTGRMISSSDVIRTISTNGMAAGVYMLRLTNGSDVKTQKIVVK